MRAVLWFFVGVGVGATASLFLAPASGKETRAAFSDAAAGAVEAAGVRIDELTQKAKGAVGKAKKKAVETASTVAEQSQS